MLSMVFTVVFMKLLLHKYRIAIAILCCRRRTAVVSQSSGTTSHNRRLTRRRLEPLSSLITCQIGLLLLITACVPVYRWHVNLCCTCP
jgi:hypothetical protein